jgi:hypothetical protein
LRSETARFYLDNGAAKLLARIERSAPKKTPLTPDNQAQEFWDLNPEPFNPTRLRC